MHAWWVVAAVVYVLIILHAAWYLLSYRYQYKPLAPQSVIDAFLAQSRKNMGLDYIDMNKLQYDWVESNGARLRIVIFEAPAGSPCVVFVPGTAAYALCYIEFLYKLHREGFHVIGMDPRGHGYSIPPRGSFTIEELADDALEVCRYAKKRFNTRVGLAGSSQGGITTFYAAAKGEVISSAMCHNIADLNGRDNLILSQFRPPAWMIPFVRLVFKLYQNYSVPLTFYLNFSQQVLKDGELSIDYFKRDPLAVIAYTCRVMRSLAKTKLACPVEEIRTPMMVLQASADAIFPMKYEKSVYDRLQKCEKRWVVLEGLPHLTLINIVWMAIPPVAEWFWHTLAPERQQAAAGGNS